MIDVTGVSEYLQRRKQNKRKPLFLGVMLLVGAAVSTGVWVYRENHRTIAVSARIVSTVPKYAIPGANPLTEVTDSEAGQAVIDYYEDKAEQEAFAETYEDIHVYAKKAKSSDVQIVFAKYGMKIKGIYTLVPGLGTLYVREGKTEDGSVYQIAEKAGDEEEKRVVDILLQQEDVRQLFEQVQEEYEQALASDAMLRERLADLQNAASE